MIVGDSFVFIHNPKTAGTSVREALLPHGVTDKQHAGLFPPRGYQSKQFRIVCVRNPFDRVVSGYEYSQRDVTPTERPSFEEWIMSEKPWMIGPFDFKRVPQSYWTWGCNRILRFEHLEDDFNNLLAEMEISTRLEHKNQSERRPDYWSYYTPKIKAIVKDRCQTDLTKFGYEF